MDTINRRPTIFRKTNNVVLFGLLFGGGFIVTLVISKLILLIGYDAHVEASINNLSHYPEMIPLMKWMQALMVIGTMIIPSLLYAYWQKEPIGEYLGLGFNKLSVSKLTLAILLFITILPLVAYVAAINESIKLPSYLAPLELLLRQYEDKAKSLTDSFLQMNNVFDLLINILVIGVVAAVGEELVFRAVLQNSISRVIHNPWVVILFSSFIFSAIHFQFYGFLPRFLLGAVLGFVYYYTHSLWITIFLHLMNNAIQVMLYYFYIKKISRIDINQTPEFPAFLVVISIVATIILAYTLYKNSFNDNKLLQSDI